jgi:hypothetical protein
MSDSSVIDSTPVDDMTNDEILDGRKYRINNKPSTPQERKRQRDLENEMNIRMNNQTLSPEIKKSLEELTFDVNNMSIWDARAILKELDMLKQISYDKAEYNKGDKYLLAKREVRKRFNELLKEDREEAKTEKRDSESLLPETKIDDKDFFGKMSGIYNLDKYAVKIFNLDRKHIP